MRQEHIWESNLVTLRKTHPQLLKRITSVYRHAPDVNSHVVDFASVARSIRDALENPAILVWLGLRDARILLEYARHPHSRQVHIIVIEPRLECFAAELGETDLSDLFASPSVSWFVGLDPFQLEIELRTLFTTPKLAPMTLCVEYVTHPSLPPEDARVLTEVRDEARRMVLELASYMNTEELDAYQGLLNVLGNLSAFTRYPSVSGLAGFGRGLTGIIVSTGPSLNRRLEMLRQYADRALIYCADSALGILLREGIRPHFVGTVERLLATSDMLEGFGDMSDVYLVANPFIVGRTFEVYHGPVLAMFRDLAIQRWFFPQEPTFYPGASVAHYGYNLLRHLGCSTIAVVGQDLAYDESTKLSHAGGMIFQSSSDDELQRPQETWLEGNSGKPVRSTLGWKLFRDIFTDMLLRDKTSCLNVIEANVGAAIPGMTRINPEDFVVSPVDGDLRKRLQEAVLRCAPPKYDPQRPQQTREWLNAYARGCERVLEQISTIFRSSLPALSRGEVPAGLEKAFNILEKAGAELQQDPHGLYESLLAHFIQPRMFDISRESYVVLGKNLSPAVRTLKQFDLVAEWFSLSAFWARQVEYAVACYETQEGPAD